MSSHILQGYVSVRMQSSDLAVLRTAMAWTCLFGKHDGQGTCNVVPGTVELLVVVVLHSTVSFKTHGRQRQTNLSLTIQGRCFFCTGETWLDMLSPDPAPHRHRNLRW